MQKVITSYRAISNRIGVKLHSEKGLEKFKQRITQSRESFLLFSRTKSAQAQKRVIATTQPKEALSTGIKTPIEIKNYLGGKYLLTVDDVIVRDDKYNLIESKHSERVMLPGENDIKDGLIRMLLFSNIDELYRIEIPGKDINSEQLINFIPVLRLTSVKINGTITSKNSEREVESFLQSNGIKNKQIWFVKKLFDEAKANNFEVIIEYGAREKE